MTTSNNPLIGVSSNKSGGFSGQNNADSLFGSDNLANTYTKAPMTPLEPQVNNHNETFAFNDTPYIGSTAGFKMPENNAYANINPINYPNYSATEYYLVPQNTSVLGPNLLFNDLYSGFDQGNNPPSSIQIYEWLSTDPEFNKLSASEREPYYISLLSKHLYDSIIPDDSAPVMDRGLYNAYMNLFASLLPDSDDYMAGYNMSGMPADDNEKLCFDPVEWALDKLNLKKECLNDVFDSNRRQETQEFINKKDEKEAKNPEVVELNLQAGLSWSSWKSFNDKEKNEISVDISNTKEINNALDKYNTIDSLIITSETIDPNSQGVTGMFIGPEKDKLKDIKEYIGFKTLNSNEKPNMPQILHKLLENKQVKKVFLKGCETGGNNKIANVESLASRLSKYYPGVEFYGLPHKLKVFSNETDTRYIKYITDDKGQTKYTYMF